MLARPQVEDGFTKIANELLEMMPLYKFNGSQYAILLILMRYTYGFNRKTCSLSLNFLSKATGISKRNVQRDLDFLIKNHVILVTEQAGFKQSRELSFNKNYHLWTLGKRELSNLTTVVKSDNATVGEFDNPPVVKSDNQERKGFKEILKKEDEEEKEKKEKGAVPFAYDEKIRAFVDNVAVHYETLTGRGWSFGLEREIYQIALKTSDAVLVKQAMSATAAKYKPKYEGDAVRSFGYFVPGIMEVLESAKMIGGLDSASNIGADATGQRKSGSAGLGVHL